MNAVKFNEYASVVVSAGYDRSLRVWDCRSHSTEPIQVVFFTSKNFVVDAGNKCMLTYSSKVLVDVQIIDTFSDTVMSVCLTKTEIIGGSVDGTVRTFDIRIGRYVTLWYRIHKTHLFALSENFCVLKRRLLFEELLFSYAT